MTDIEAVARNFQETVDSLGLAYSAEFVPFSKSRSYVKDAKLNDYSLNWKVTISKEGRSLSTDYSQGIAHIPGYKHSFSLTVDEFESVKRSCETGKVGTFAVKNIPAPLLRDVLYSLALDAESIDYSSFEEWAENFGYDADSRKAERIYQGCVKLALELRAMIGDEGIAKLREASRDY